MGRPIVGEFQPGRSTKIRVYGLPIDFLNSGDDSPFGWIYQGTVDFDMFFTSGRHSQDKGDDSSDGIQTMVKIAEQMRDIRIKLMGEVVEPIKVKLIDELRDLSRLLDETLESSSMQPDQQEQEQLQPPNGSAVDQIETTSPSIVTVGPIEEDLSFLMDIRFNNIRAEMPSQTSNTTSLLVRPIIAYLNAQARNGKSATPPVTVKFKIPLESFSGSQTVYQCGFMSNLSETLTVALSKRVLLRYNNYLKQGKRRQRKERSKESSSTQNDAEEVGWYTWAFGWITPSQSRHRLPVAESKNDDPVLTIDDVEDYDESEDDGADTNDDDDDDEQDESWIGRIATGMSWWSLQQLGRQIVYSWESGRQTGSMYPRSAEERYDEMYNEIIWGHP
jgi:hypothetical protein